MADTNPGAEEALKNPAEATQTAGSVELKDDAKLESAEATEVAKVDTANAKTEEETATHEKPTETAKNGESSAAGSEEKASNGDEEKRGEKRNYRDDRKSDRGNRGRYNDRPQERRYKKSRPEEFADLPETDDPVEIRQQVEFYFSVQNLSSDKHMFLELDGANNRPVSIKHLHSFKRMKRFQPYSAIITALRDSETLVVVDDGKYSGPGNEGVKRKEAISVPKYDGDEKRTPTAEELFERMFRRSRNSLDASIYVKGFGDEDAAGQIVLEKFFRPYGAVMVRKRRDDNDKWKGSVFVEFENPEAQQQFLALDPKPKFNDNELTIMSKKEYSEMKCKEKGITPAWERQSGYGENTRRHNGPGNDRRGGGRGRGGRGSHGGRGRGRGGYNDRSGRRDRDRSRSRSPRRRRDRSGSRESVDSRDWNGRRDKFQKSRGHKHDRNDTKDEKPADPNNKWGIVKDENGVPVIRDTREKPASPDSKKRKAGGNERDDSPKKNKIEIKEDA